MVRSPPQPSETGFFTSCTRPRRSSGAAQLIRCSRLAGGGSMIARGCRRLGRSAREVGFVARLQPGLWPLARREGATRSNPVVTYREVEHGPGEGDAVGTTGGDRNTSGGPGAEAEGGVGVSLATCTRRNPGADDFRTGLIFRPGRSKPLRLPPRRTTRRGRIPVDPRWAYDGRLN